MNSRQKEVVVVDFVSGSRSKGIAGRGSDTDYKTITRREKLSDYIPVKYLEYNSVKIFKENNDDYERRDITSFINLGLKSDINIIEWCECIKNLTTKPSESMINIADHLYERADKYKLFKGAEGQMKKASSDICSKIIRKNEWYSEIPVKSFVNLLYWSSMTQQFMKESGDYTFDFNKHHNDYKEHMPFLLDNKNKKLGDIYYNSTKNLDFLSETLTELTDKFHQKNYDKYVLELRGEAPKHDVNYIHENLLNIFNN